MVTGVAGLTYLLQPISHMSVYPSGISFWFAPATSSLKSLRQTFSHILLLYIV